MARYRRQYLGFGRTCPWRGAHVNLLRGDDTVPHDEVIWALEAISGMTYGDDQDRWSLWWQGLPVEVREARRWYGEEEYEKK